MESNMVKVQKCNSKKHEDINAVVFCKDCNKFLCNKCKNFHSDLFDNHKLTPINNNNSEQNDVFTGFCTEEGHLEKLEFYCKNHNKLCCSSCIIKIQKNGKGMHSNCEICNNEDIKDNKKENLKNNNAMLKEFSKSVEQTTLDLEKISTKLNNNKENLKIEIQNIFTKLRTKLNDREDELLKKVDENFDELLYKEDIIKKGKKLQNTIKASLEKSEETLNKNWDDNNELNKLIHNCIIIENDIKNINLIYDNIKKYKSIEIKLNIEQNSIELLNDIIKNLGNIKKEEMKKAYNNIKGLLKKNRRRRKKHLNKFNNENNKEINNIEFNFDNNDDLNDINIGNKENDFDNDLDDNEDYDYYEEMLYEGDRKKKEKK